MLMPSNQVVKSTARTALKNKWFQAICVGLILMSVKFLEMSFGQLAIFVLKADGVLSPFSIESILNINDPSNIFVTILTTVFSFFVFYPLLLGVFRWFWRLTAGADDSVAGIFSYYGSADVYFGAIKIIWGFFWRLCATSIVMFLPYALIHTALSPTIYELFGTTMPLALSSIASIESVFVLLGVVGVIFVMIRYFAVLPIIFTNEQIPLKAAFKLSPKVSQGARGTFFVFLVSFIAWIFASLLVIPLLFVVPYILAAITVFWRFTVSRYQLMNSQKAPI